MHGPVRDFAPSRSACSEEHGVHHRSPAAGRSASALPAAPPPPPDRRCRGRLPRADRARQGGPQAARRRAASRLPPPAPLALLSAPERSAGLREHGRPTVAAPCVRRRAISSDDCPGEGQQAQRGQKRHGYAAPMNRRGSGGGASLVATIATGVRLSGAVACTAMSDGSGECNWDGIGRWCLYAPHECVCQPFRHLMRGACPALLLTHPPTITRSRQCRCIEAA